MKVVVLTNILAPYRVALFEALQDRVENLQVVLMADSEENREWVLPTVSFPVKVLPGFHLKPPGYAISLHVNYGIQRLLRSLNPDLVLSGGFGVANFSALIYCLMANIPYVSWGELLPGRQDSIWHIRGQVRRLFGRWSSGAVASSSKAKTAFCSYGIPRDQVCLSLMPFDVDKFRTETQVCRATPSANPHVGKFSRPCLLHVGRVIHEKGLRELFDIYERVLVARPSSSLVLVGDGPDRDWYEGLVKTRSWKNVHFEGYVQQERLPSYFAVADVVVFPTLHDHFGAVLGEAMAAGVPVVASGYAAATHDLIQHGVSGFCIDPYDTPQASRMIVQALEMSEEQKEVMVAEGHVRIKDQACPSAAQAMVEFFQSLMPRQRSFRKSFLSDLIVFKKEKGRRSL